MIFHGPAFRVRQSAQHKDPPPDAGGEPHRDWPGFGLQTTPARHQGGIRPAEVDAGGPFLREAHEH